MGVVKTRNAQALLPRLAFDFDQFQRGDAVAIVSRIGAGVAGSRCRGHAPSFRRGLAQQRATALVGIGLFAMSADRIIDGSRDSQYAHDSSQKRSLRYLSAESGSTVTIVASRPAAASSCAMRILATIAAAAEMPTSNPSSRASRLAIA